MSSIVGATYLYVRSTDNSMAKNLDILALPFLASSHSSQARQEGVALGLPYTVARRIKIKPWVAEE